MNKISLVLEGGGMRGVFTTGVLDYFMEKNIKFDTVFAVSAGALNACWYLCNQKGASIKINLENINNSEFCSVKSLIKTGNIFGTDLLFNKIPHEILPMDIEHFKKSKSKFYCVATNVITGLPEYLEVKDIFKDMDYVKASSSLPLVSKMVKINENLYLDGGVGDSIPVKEAFNKGCDKCVVILTQPPGFVKTKSKASRFIENSYKKYPNFVDMCANRHIYYNQSLEFIEDNEDCFVIQPKTDLKVKKTERNKEKIINAYNLGYETAKEISNELIEFIKKDAN